jgi:hypothetical protein
VALVLYKTLVGMTFSSSGVLFTSLRKEWAQRA